MLDNYLPKNKRGFIKKNITQIDKLIINKPIIAEIPQLIYTGITTDYLESNILKILFEQNKKKFRISRSFNECLKEIKKK